jgi:hypothetical protein
LETQECFRWQPQIVMDHNGDKVQRLRDHHAQQPVAVSSRSDLERLSVALPQNEMPLSKPVRLLGISLSALLGDDQAELQLGLPI